MRDCCGYVRHVIAESGLLSLAGGMIVGSLAVGAAWLPPAAAIVIMSPLYLTMPLSQASMAIQNTITNHARCIGTATTVAVPGG